MSLGVCVCVCIQIDSNVLSCVSQLKVVCLERTFPQCLIDVAREPLALLFFKNMYLFDVQHMVYFRRFESHWPIPNSATGHFQKRPVDGTVGKC